MKTIQHLISRYTSTLWGFLKPLGVWGVFIGAILDGGAVGLPVDIVVAGYVAENHHRLLLYVIVASLGSAIGSLVIYLIGYLGGEELLRKRVSPERFAKLHTAFDEHPFWSLMFPAMLPPPTPFKLFALGAAVAEMNVGHFFLAIFLGRAMRFLILGLLVIRFGPGIVHTLRRFSSHHFHWLVIIVVGAVVAWLVIKRLRKKKTPSDDTSHAGEEEQH